MNFFPLACLSRCFWTAPGQSSSNRGHPISLNGSSATGAATPLLPLEARDNVLSVCHKRDDGLLKLHGDALLRSFSPDAANPNGCLVNFRVKFRVRSYIHAQVSKLPESGRCPFSHHGLRDPSPVTPRRARARD